MEYTILLSSSSSESESEENGKSVEDDKTTTPHSSHSRQSQSQSGSQSGSGNESESENSAITTSQKRVLADQKAKKYAIRRAKEVQANLDPQFHSFLKSFGQQSDISDFKLMLPTQFCNDHLPNQNVMITLVDENQKEYPVRYDVQRIALTKGWNAFFIAQNLVEGDVLIFQLVNQLNQLVKPKKSKVFQRVRTPKFKVYIIRAYSRAKIDGAHSFPNLDACKKRRTLCKRTKTSEKKVRKRQKTLPLARLKQVEQRNSKSDGDEEVDSEDTERTTLSETIAEFKDMKNLEDFAVAVKRFLKDSELSDREMTRYYELCCSQKACLHGNLPEGTNSKFVAGMMSQIIDIADALKASDLTTPQDKFAAWDKSLRACEEFGMNVEFLRARLQKLVSIVIESEEAAVSKRYREAMKGRAEIEEEIKTVRDKLAKLEETSERFEKEMETLKENVECHELQFQAAVDTAW